MISRGKIKNVTAEGRQKKVYSESLKDEWDFQAGDFKTGIPGRISVLNAGKHWQGKDGIKCTLWLGFIRWSGDMQKGKKYNADKLVFFHLTNTHHFYNCDFKRMF